MTAGPGETLFSFVRFWSRRDSGAGRSVMVAEAVHALAQRGVAPTVNAISHELGIDQSGASRMVTAATEAGYLRSRPTATDGRRRESTITPSGRRLLGQAHAWQEQVFDELTTGWSDRRRREFARSMRELMERSADRTC